MIAAGSAVRAAKAQAEHAAADRKRYEDLVALRFVATSAADAFRAAAITADQEVNRLSALYDAARHSQSVMGAKRAMIEAALQKASAAVEHAQATLNLAKMELRHVTIVAPIDGVVGNRQV